MTAEFFETAGICFFAESDQEMTASKEEVDCDFQIKSIDIIGHPQFNEIMKYYRLPVFMKADDYLASGKVDNGRHVIELEGKEEVKRGSTGAFSPDYVGEQESGTRSVFDRLK